MTLLKRATIKSYDAGSHRAAVGIAGSLSVWLNDLAVSDAIAAATVVVGNECSVLFHTDDNPDDAVVISVHGAGPITPISDFLSLSDTPGSYSGQALKQMRVNAGETALEFAAGGAGGTPTLIEDADQDTKVQAEESADEDILRFDTAGAQRMTIDASGNIAATGAVTVQGNLTIGALGKLIGQKAQGHYLGTAPADDSYQLFQGGVLSPPVAAAGQIAGMLRQQPTLMPNADGQYFYGVSGQATVIGASYNIAKIAGLYFIAIVAGGGSPGKTVTELVGAESLPGKFGAGYLTLTDVTGFKESVGFMTPTNTTLTRWQGFWASFAGSSAITTHAGLRITDITAGTNRHLIWAGPNVPSGAGLTNLRLDAGNPANAGLAAEGDSQLNLTFNENGVLAMRNVRWRTFATLAAADKVMIAQ